MSNDTRQTEIALRNVVRLGLFKDPLFGKLLALHRADPEDLELVALLQEGISVAEEREVLDPNPFRAELPSAHDTFPVGLIAGRVKETDVIWRIPEEQLVQHTLLLGRTGGGKTNTAISLVAQLLEKGITVQIFDRKGDFACFSGNRDFLYWLFDDHHVNWIEPTIGLTPRQWLGIFFEICGNHVDIMAATRSLCTKLCLDLVAEFDSEHTGRWPTLLDLYFRLKRIKFPAISNLARHQETGINRLEGLFAVFGNNICSQRRLNWDRYLNSSWAISLQGIPTDLQSLFISVTISKLLSYRIANNLRSSSLNCLIVLDEASTVFKKSYETRESTHLLSDYLAQAREFGIGFLIGTQSLSQLSESVSSNTGTKVLVGGCGSGRDYDLFASATGMNREQREHIARHMMPGVAFVRDPRWPTVFQVEVPKVV